MQCNAKKVFSFHAVPISFTSWMPNICFMLNLFYCSTCSIQKQPKHTYLCIELRASNKDHIILLRPSHWKCLFSLPSVYMKLYLIIKLLPFIPSCLTMNTNFFGIHNTANINQGFILYIIKCHKVDLLETWSF